MSLQRKILITGTDTHVGKTLVTASLLKVLQQAKRSVVAVKPLAAGSEWIDGQLKNADALLLSKTMQTKLSYHTINPVCLELPVAPHIAAQQAKVPLTVNLLRQACHLSQHSQDYLLVEGAGGWLVPLNATETLADFAVAEQMDIILVVAMKLGCINHTLLTVQSILASGLNLVAWVANTTRPEMPYLQDNIQTLTDRIKAPLIAKIPFIPTNKLIEEASNYVSYKDLMLI